jgi:hypothetical protein
MFKTAGEGHSAIWATAFIAIVFIAVNPLMGLKVLRAGHPYAAPVALVAACGAEPLTGGPDGFGGCFPGTANTGYPDGATLNTGCGITPDGDGVYNLNVASATYDLCDFPGVVYIRASGITIKNSLIEGSVGGVGDDLQGLVIQDSIIDCNCPSVGEFDTPSAILGDHFTLTRVELYDSGHGLAIGSNVTVQDSYIHGLGGDTLAHKDGIFIGGGDTNTTIRHNNIECADGPSQGCTAAIFFSSDFGNSTFFTLNNNLLNTNGAYCFYGSGGPAKLPNHSTNITFTNNHFGRKNFPNCANFGPVTYWDVTAPGMVWNGNVWQDTGAVVDPVY